jgi:predicted MFS family arabinose efflux permease
VLAGGVLAAIIGPELAKLTVGLIESSLYAGSFAALIVVAIIALLLVQLIDIPPPGAAERTRPARSAREIARQPSFVTAVIGGVAGYAAMSFVMTATPLAMVAHQHSFASAASVIQWHIFAMFAPSFFTGRIIKRFGVLNVMRAGGGFILVCVVVNFLGAQAANFWIALVLLGLGWNFMFIGATTLLTEAYRPAEKALVQAANDFLVFGASTLAAFAAGVTFHAFGWATTNVAIVPLVLASFAATFWLARARRLQAGVETA